MVTTGALLYIAIAASILAAGTALHFWLRIQTQNRALQRFQLIRDVEAHVAGEKAQLDLYQKQRTREVEAYVANERARLDLYQKERSREIEQQLAKDKAALGQFQASAAAQMAKSRSEIDTISKEITAAAAARVAETARALELRKEIEQLEEAQDLQEFGFYRARYAFNTPEEYKAKLEKVRAAQKAMVKAKTAVPCENAWTVNGSAAKGRKMVGEQVKLMLRAFNGESDAAIAKVKYNNADSLEKRIKKAAEAINKLGSTKGASISDEYSRLKLNELYLSHEYQEKLQEEREEQRRRREQLKEEEKAQHEIEKAISDAEGEETRIAKALQKAQDEMQEAHGKQLEKFEQLVSKLQNELSAAIDRKAKAIARAQLTKSGHVYVLSNVGSFGEGVYKIGMTRRFEPLERVRELGVASVPFFFDVHAMIYSEDAPKLEGLLHKEFASRRVNRVNLRREYFRVTLDEVRRAVAKHHGIVTFVLEPEAEEYRKTLAMQLPANDLTARGA